MGNMEFLGHVSRIDNVAPYPIATFLTSQ